MNEELTDKELEQMLDHDRLAVFMSHVSTDDVTAAAADQLITCRCGFLTDELILLH